jgi:hypothetical protein
VTRSTTWWHLTRGRGARWGVVVLWLLGAVLSYAALRDLAVMLGFPVPLADLFPLVIDVAVWVGSLNALEAAELGRRPIARYAWVLVGGYSLATVAGNALVASTETVDPRLVHALGETWAHAVSGVAHAAPAVTMVLFAHLAGLLMGGRPELRPEAMAAVIEDVAMAAAQGAVPVTAPGPTWPAIEKPAAIPGHGHAMAAPMAIAPPTDGRDRGRSVTAPMAATAAMQTAVRLVQRGRASGREVTTAEMQRATGRSARQARRLLAAALAEVDGDGQPPRPHVVGEGR